MATNHYTDKTYYEYDATLTQDLLTKYINTLSSSTAIKTDQTYLGDMVNMSHFTGSRHQPNPEISSGESEEPHPSTVTHDYRNFVSATGVNFDQARSAAVAAGVDVSRIKNAISLNDSGCQATNITFAEGGAAAAYASNTTLSNLTFLGQGGVVEIGGGFVNDANENPIYVGGQSLNGLKAEDLDKIILYPPSRQAATSAVTATDITVSRNLNDLAVAAATNYGYYGKDANSNNPGTGVEASKITVHGALRYVNIGSGARVDSLTVGDWKQWGDGEASAFLGEDVWGSTSHMSATCMNVYSGGTATNIDLGFGGEVYVSGPGIIYSSQLVSSAGQSWYETTSSEGTGAGGVLTDLKVAVGGGIQFTGTSASELNLRLWDEPRNGYGNRPYMSGFLATAPQSAYVEFGKFTSGNNIEIGNGGSMRIDSGASVSNISMTALNNASMFVKNGSGVTETWIGDRGAMLSIYDNAVVSNVCVEAANMTFDYYSAAYDYFWLYSSAISSSMEAAYSSAHGETPSGEAWESSVYASASAGYRQYMSNCFVSGGHYTNLGDDTNGYQHKYVGGSVGIGAAYVDRISGFATLSVTGNATVTSSGGKITYSALNGSVTNASGALSATVNVGGGAHLSNVTVQGGRVVMGGAEGRGGVARYTGSANPQSNFARVEDLNLRTSDLVGDNNSAVIIFSGGGGGGWSTPRMDANGNYIKDDNGNIIYDDYSYDCIDPGEIVSAVGNSGLTVQGTYGRFTYTGTGAVTFVGLGTIRSEQAGDRSYFSSSYYSSSADGTSSAVREIRRWLEPSSTHYEFGVVKGVFDEETGRLQETWAYDGNKGFDWTGVLAVGSGAVIQNVGTKAGLKTANTLTSDSWNPVIEQDVSKILYVLAGGSAHNVAVTDKVTNYEITSTSLYKSNAALVVSSGGTATDISVLSGGIAMAVGGTIDGAFVGNGGILYLSGWGGAIQVSSDGGQTIADAQYLDETVLNNVHLDKGGQLGAIYDTQFGGKAPSIIANTGGGILNGVTANGAAYISSVDFAGAVTLAGGQKALDVTVRGFTKVTSTDSDGNPTAWTTTIATLNVSSGGIVNGATVGEEGAIYVSDGADVSNLVASGGRLIFGNSSGWSDYFPGSAAVAGITVMDGGILQVNSKFALTTMDMQIRESAGLEIAIVKDANEEYAKTELNGTWTASWGSGEFRTTDGVLSGFGGQFGYKYTDPLTSSAYTSARLSMTFLNGAMLIDADMRGYGYFTVKNGAKVLNTKLKGITANIGASGYASGLSAVTDPTNSAYQTNIYVYGSGALTEQTVLCGGFMEVETNGVANGVTMLAPEGYEGPAGDNETVGPAELEISTGGSATNVIASAGVVTLYKGSSKESGMGPATLSNAEIHSAAMLLVNADGVVLDGALKVGGSVVTTATRYEYIPIVVTSPNTGETYTDYERVEKNNAVADAKTLTVSFDLTEHPDGFETALIDNLANLDGAKYEFIYVNEDQAIGSYVLAGNAENYKNGTLKVVRGGKFAGTITVSDGWGVLQVEDDLIYSVNHNVNNELVFSVESTEAAITNIVATSDGRELLKGKWSKYSVNIKTEVNKYSTSIWYRIKQAVKTRGRGVDGDDEGWLEFDNENGIDITEYCTVEFKAKNEKGKDSEIVSYTVNYDATAPEFSGLRIDSGETFLTAGVESQVSVLVWDELDLAPKVELCLGNDEWTELALDDDSRAVFTVKGGIDSFTLRATDHADNMNTLVISIPAVPVVSADIITVTNRDVTLTAEFGADAIVKQYSRDGGVTWEAYDENGVVLQDNATVSFRAGNLLGYSGTTTLTVDYIDKEPPKAPEAKADITTFTNQNVTVTATFSMDSVKKLYSLDGGENWEDYNEGGVIIIINGTVGFCGVDEAGNTSQVTYVEVNNIDRDPPVITLTGDNRTPLQASTLTASTEDNVDIFYSLDKESENWTKYEGEIPVTENATYYFKGTDAAGNVGTAEYVFENIDNTAPVIMLTGDNRTPLQASTLTASTEDNVDIFYSLDKESEIWTKYEGEIPVTANGTYYFKATDAAGNVGTAEYVFENIDNTAPVITLTGDNRTPLQRSTLTAEVDDSSEIFFSTDNENWTKYEGEIPVTANGTYYFKATDAVGNVGTAEYVFENIDTFPPEDPVAVANIVDITDQDVTVTATFSEDSAVREYSFDGENWKPYTDGLVFEKNGTVSFRAADAVGNMSGIVTFTVDNIVKNGPDNHKNDSLFDDSGNLNPDLADSEIPIQAGTGTAESGGIPLDSSVDFLAGNNETYHNFVGANDDTADYAQITMESAAKLRFSISSYDQTKKGKVKFSLISYDSTTGSKKVLKSATSSKNKTAKTATVYVNPNDPKTAGLQYFVAVENKGKTDVFYNVALTDDSCVYTDGDKGENNGPLLVKVGKTKLANAVQIEKFQTVNIAESGTQDIQFDTNLIAAGGAPVLDGGWNNFVGYSDDNDYAKLSATQPVKLSFTIKATGSVKLVVYSISNSGGKWVQDTVKTLTVSLTKAEKNGSGYATRSAEIRLDRLAGTDATGYYVSVQSTNAKSGGMAWYNANVDSIVYASDYGTNNKLFLDTKSKSLNTSVAQTTAAGEKTAVGMEFLGENDNVDAGRTVGETIYGNFVGFGDEYDYAEIVFTDTGTCTFELETWGTAKASAKLTVYKLTLKNGKWSKRSIGSIKVRNSNDAADGYASGSDSKSGIKIDAVTGDNVRYYVGVQSIDAKKGKEVYYNVFATLSGTSSGSALAMPDQEAPIASAAENDGSDILGETGFGQYADTDMLTDVSVSLPGNDSLFGQTSGLLA